jgi:uncharacterized protein involved in outer membrane biogenesis
MTASRRGRLWIGGGGLVGLLIAALLAVPLLIDINSYKPEIVAQVKRATGRDLVIDGAIRLALLPLPSVRVDGVKFFNMPGSKNPNMVEVKSVTVRPSLLALLIGNVEVGEVTLVEPKIVLEINAQGKPNWEFTPSVAEAQPAAAKPSSPKPLSLGRLTIDNGTLIFSDSKAGLSVAAEKANFTASVGSVDGPYSLAGSATVNDSPLKVDLSVSAKGPSGHNTEVALEAGGGRLSYRGTLSELGPDARLSGMASASADNLVAFARALIQIAGQPLPPLPPLLAGKFKFDGPIELSQTAFAAKDFKLALGEDSGSGSLALVLKSAPAVDAKFTASRFDLDRWLAAIALPPQATAEAVPLTAPPLAAPAATPAPRAEPSLLATITAKLALEVGEVIYNKKPIRSLALELDARGGAVAVPKFTVTLPGDLAVQARSTMSGDPSRPTVSGDFSLVGPKLRETLSWLQVDVSSVAANKLTQLSVKGRMASNAGNILVNDAVFELDDLKGAGGIVVSFTVPVSVMTRIELDTLDLDAYLPTASQGPVASASPVASVTPILALLGPSIGLKLKVARINYHGDAAMGVDVDVSREAGTLRMNDIRVANLAGARLAVRGVVANYWTPQPQADFAFNVEAPDVDRILKLAGAAPAGIGALAASGGVAGGWAKLTVRDCALNAMGWNVKANGSLALSGAAEGKIKSASYKGNILVNGQPIEASIDANLAGDKPVIAADLKAGVLDFDKLGASGGASRAPARGQPAAESQAIGTPLLAVDGTLKVSAASLGGASGRFGNAEIAASLKDGVLTVAHFKGGLYGGTLSLSGVVNGSQPSLSFDLKGDASGIDLTEMLRSSSGTNEIGSLIKITIDGSLNASAIELRGAGTTIAQITGSMAGGAQLSGHIHARADRFLQVLGSAATGVAGGVIDNTLGNVMSVLGEKGGVGIGNLLNAISLVLNRFVNHDNALSGRVDIAGGVLTDRDLQMQGNGATAHVVTRTNLANATTDTTINFMLAEDRSAPYLIVTAHGPLAAPSFNATRGSAKDPPGLTSILPNVGNALPHVPLPSVSIPVPHLPGIFGR